MREGCRPQGFNVRVLCQATDGYDAMPIVPSQSPFAQVSFAHQPFGIRVRCVLDLPGLSKARQTTGVAIEATGAMQSWFGLGPFSKNMIREVAQSLGVLLSSLDRNEGTTFLYWGTNDPGLLQPLGFRTAEQWRSFPFIAPRTFGHSRHLLPAIKYFTEGIHPGTGRRFREGSTSRGIFVFLLDGAIEDFEEVRGYCLKLAEESESDSHPITLISVGFGSQFLENSRGQMQALAAQFGRLKTPIFSSVVADELLAVPEVAREAIMANVIVAEMGVVFDASGKEIRRFPSGLPGMFEFYLSANATAFSVNIDGIIHEQTLC